jgi:hypothetical protein
MPNGRFSPWAKIALVSATPSASESRSSMILLGLSCRAPARFWTSWATQSLKVLGGLGSDEDSAARTSPLGRTSSQRG